MTDRELFEEALEALEHLHRTGDTQVFDLCYAPELIPALKERLAQPEQEPIIDKSAAIRIATALGWVPAGDTSPERVDEAGKQRQEHLPSVLEVAVKSEREACAKLCEARYMGDNTREDMEARRCAAAIRARGQA